MATTYSFSRRIQVLMVGSILLFAILTMRLVDLQIIRHSHYANIAEAQRKRASELLPHRGTIYVSEGKGKDIFPVASNQKGWVAYAVPRDMEDPYKVAEELAPAIHAFRKRQEQRVTDIVARTGQNRIQTEQEETEEGEEEPTPTPAPNDEDVVRELVAKLKQQFDQKTDPYETFLRPHEVLDDELKAFLDERKYKGIVVEEQEVRVYPEGELAAHAIGYVGFDFDNEQRVGRYGVEGFFESKLRGDFGWLSGERAGSGQFIGVAASEFRPAEDGADVVLTIDRVIQSFVEKELKDGVERYGAERGSIIVMNPKTGAILGMATYPTFDPNTYYAVKDARVQTNPVVSDIFEPGSILKPVIMAGAINEGLVEPNTTFVDNGPVKVDKYTINTFDGKHLGVQTMTQVLEQSNNIGMVWLSNIMGKEMMYDYLRRFGMGERTGVELDGETQTNLREPRDWNITNTATISFGQGIAVTPLQALNAVNAIANDGKLVQPHIVSSVRYPNGEIEETTPTVVKHVVTEQTAAKVSAMMVSVLENGVAGLARVPGYYLAGKTGTAQVADETGKYSADKKIISFAGFGPVPDPEFSILIKLDNPSGLSFASGTAAPMFRNLSEKILNYYQIPPAYDDSIKQPRFEVGN